MLKICKPLHDLLVLEVLPEGRQQLEQKTVPVLTDPLASSHDADVHQQEVGQRPGERVEHSSKAITQICRVTRKQLQTTLCIIGKFQTWRKTKSEYENMRSGSNLKH